jgi:hypothetical protein
MAHGQIVILDRAIAGDFGRTIHAFGQLKARRRHRVGFGTGGAEACGAGVLQAASAKHAATRGAIVFMSPERVAVGWRPPEGTAICLL